MWCNSSDNGPRGARTAPSRRAILKNTATPWTPRSSCAVHRPSGMLCRSRITTQLCKPTESMITASPA